MRRTRDRGNVPQREVEVVAVGNTVVTDSRMTHGLGRSREPPSVPAPPPSVVSEQGRLGELLPRVEPVEQVPPPKRPRFDQPFRSQLQRRR